MLAIDELLRNDVLEIKEELHLLRVHVQSLNNQLEQYKNLEEVLSFIWQTVVTRLALGDIEEHKVLISFLSEVASKFKMTDKKIDEEYMLYKSFIQVADTANRELSQRKTEPKRLTKKTSIDKRVKK